MKVYTVSDTDGSGYEILKAFDTKEKAEKCVKEWEEEGNDIDNVKIEELEVE